MVFGTDQKLCTIWKIAQRTRGVMVSDLITSAPAPACVCSSCFQSDSRSTYKHTYLALASRVKYRKKPPKRKQCLQCPVDHCFLLSVK